METLNLLLLLLPLYLLYHLLLALYNLSPLHPLHRFPGPRLAAATPLYEAYHEFLLGGRYTSRIRAMHALHGPVVRISPAELHCADPAFADAIYPPAGARRVRDKWQHQLNTAPPGPVTVAGFATVGHELHRVRRGAVARFFSRREVGRAEGEVVGVAGETVDRMMSAEGKGRFDVKQAMNCFTADVIGKFAFGEDLGFVSAGGGTVWEPNLGTWVQSFIRTAYMMRHVGVVRRLAMLAPLLADWLGEDMRRVMHLLRVVVPGFVKKAIEHPDGDGRVFAQLVEANPGILEDDKGGLGVDWMVGEGFNFLLAGTETTAANLTVIVFWLLAKPEIHARLMEELGDLTPETLRWTDLENRPYMWALVHESLRVMPGITARTARIARDEDLVYESQDGKVQWVIPRGTPIGMSPIINHHDKELFPNSDEFDPDRWLVDGQRNFALAKNLMAFGKGSRSCLGENLAYCELYIMTAMMAMRVIPRARLSGTTAEDLAYDHDMFVLQNKKGGPISVHIEVVEA